VITLIKRRGNKLVQTPFSSIHQTHAHSHSSYSATFFILHSSQSTEKLNFLIKIRRKIIQFINLAILLQAASEKKMKRTNEDFCLCVWESKISRKSKLSTNVTCFVMKAIARERQASFKL
jgi:hypothetical protein